MFLKDSQTLYNCLKIDEINSNELTKDTFNNYIKILNDNNFKSKFDYLEWKYLDF